MNNEAIQLLRSRDIVEYSYNEKLLPGLPYTSLLHNRLYIGSSLSLDEENRNIINNDSAPLLKLRPISTNDFNVYKQDLAKDNDLFTLKYLYTSYEDVENIISNSELTNDNDDVVAFIRVNELNGNLEIRSLVSGTSIGKENQFYGPRMYAIGSRNILKKGESTAIGNNNITNGHDSYTIGVGNKVNTDLSIVIGTQSKTVAANDSSSHRIAIGNLCESSGFGSITLGTYCKATEDGAVAIGYGSQALNDASFAIGWYTKTNETYSTAIGKYNEGKPNNLFEIGYGEVGTEADPDINRANVFEISKSGSFVAKGSGNIGNDLTVAANAFIGGTTKTCSLLLNYYNSPQSGNNGLIIFHNPLSELPQAISAITSVGKDLIVANANDGNIILKTTLALDTELSEIQISKNTILLESSGKVLLSNLYAAPNDSIEGATLIVNPDFTTITSGGLLINDGTLNTPDLTSYTAKIIGELTIGANSDFKINEHALTTTKRINATLFSTVSDIFENSDGRGVDTNYINVVDTASGSVKATIAGSSGLVTCGNLTASTSKGSGNITADGNLTCSLLIATSGFKSNDSSLYIVPQSSNELNTYNCDLLYLNWSGGCKGIKVCAGSGSSGGSFYCGTLYINDKQLVVY